MKNFKFTALLCLLGIIIASCFSGGGWQEDSEKGSFSINLLGQEARVLSPELRSNPNLTYKIKLTGPGPSIEQIIADAAKTQYFSVIPGEWKITVEAVFKDHYNKEEIWAFGTTTRNIKAGRNDNISIKMEEPELDGVIVFTGNWTDLKTLIENSSSSDCVIKLTGDLVADNRIDINGQNIILIADTDVGITRGSGFLGLFFHLYIDGGVGDSTSLTLGKPWMKGEITFDGGVGDDGIIEMSYDCTLVMNDKVILKNNNNTSTFGGGGTVSIYGGDFIMYGGKIIGNSTNIGNGGAVYIDYSGRALGSDEMAVFYMYGGTISGNTALNGGGVYANEAGSFRMYGGTVSGNTALENGGGVYVLTVHGGEFIKSGGTISGNTFAAVSLTPGIGKSVYSLEKEGDTYSLIPEEYNYRDDDAGPDMNTDNPNFYTFGTRL